MRNIAKYLFVAIMAAFTFASCVKEKENELLNPKGSPFQFTFSARATSETEAELKVVADSPVPADVTFAIALDGSNTMNSAGITFPAELVMAKGESEVTGQISVDIDKLVPGTTSAVFSASLAGTQFGTAKALTITKEAEPEPEPEPTGDSDIKIDGDFSDWADVTTGVVSDDDDAALKEFKVAFDKDYLYVYHKRNNNPAMWGGGYYYVLVDTDNNVTTGPANRDNLIGIDKWMYLYFFLADDNGNPVIPDAPAGAIETGDEYTCAEKALAGVISDDIVETEIRIPLADLGITYGNPIKVYTFGNKSASNLRDQPVVLSMGGSTPQPGGAVTIDGNADDWAKLNQSDVTTLECSPSADLTGLKSAKVYYDDKLYVLLEVTDAALLKGIEDGKLRVHFYFDGDNSRADGIYQHWSQPAIDCMLEGKICSGGSWCAISSTYYLWKGTDPTVWGGWESGEASPAFEYAGEGNLYECAMDYSAYPGGLADAFGLGFDIQDGDYAMLGFLPNSGAEKGPLALIVKKGAERPADPKVTIDGDFSDWAAFNGVSDGTYGMFKVSSDAENLYFYTYRTTEGRYSNLWGGEGYIYVAFDLDGNPDNGVTLNSNGPYDFIGFFFPYGGTAEAPAITEAPGVDGGWAPEEGNTLANMKCKGFADETGAYIEYSIPRADLPTIPNTPITITTWGNKDMKKVVLTATL